MAVGTSERQREALTAGQVAEALQLAPTTVRRHLRLGDIRGVRIGSGPKAQWRIPASELRRFTGGDEA